MLVRMFALISLVPLAFAQTTGTATIVGTVTDTSAAVVVGARRKAVAYLVGEGAPREPQPALVDERHLALGIRHPHQRGRGVRSCFRHHLHRGREMALHSLRRDF